MNQHITLETHGKNRGWEPYPEYKDSGYEWLGDIPAHWMVKKLKHLASAKLSNVDKKTSNGEITVLLCNYVDVYYNDYITSSINFMEATASSAEIACFALRKGDVIVTKDSESWDDIAVAAYVPSDIEGVLCGYHLAHIHPKDTLVYGEYLFRSFCAQGINYQFKVAANGVTRYGLDKYWLDNSFFPVPPIKEQYAIAASLNRETRKIDALIEKKKRLIELLQEKRTTLISHVVTKGLDPKVPMKDSGIEWLGEIPAHWALKPLKYVAIINSDVLSENTAFDWVFEYVDIGNVNSSGQILDIQETAFGDAPSRARRQVKDGDTIISTVRTYLKAIAFVSNPSENLIVSTGFAVLRPTEMIKPKYLYRMVQSKQFVDAVMSHSEGVSYPAINPGKLARLTVWLPSSPEQEQIIEYLDRETEKIDTMITKTQIAVKKLQEYRTALISAAVTGKIDVRESQA